ncbi:flagellar assembly protein FliX [Brevundimonas sp.]|uniref:flagellar assembly protein FliX n=1 Tax=Brevundimonas sp. TaxID=1871086 RepID=UPI00260C4E32|nr:flagellar assembly protein FliX [Brevundimonas sp.]
MKVNGPSGAAPAGGQRPVRSAGGFSMPQTSGAAPSSAAAATAPTSAVADVSALMALQGVETATERRRRAIRRGGTLLDRLDELKIAMLSGEAGEGALERLGRTLREERPEDEDTGLTGLLEQIDLRAAVELAKAEVRRNAA